MATNASRYTKFTSPSRHLPLVYAKVVEEGNGLDTQNRSGSISEDIFPQRIYFLLIFQITVFVFVCFTYRVCIESCSLIVSPSIMTFQVYAQPSCDCDSDWNANSVLLAFLFGRWSTELDVRSHCTQFDPNYWTRSTLTASRWKMKEKRTNTRLFITLQPLAIN